MRLELFSNAKVSILSTSPHMNSQNDNITQRWSYRLREIQTLTQSYVAGFLILMQAIVPMRQNETFMEF